jgi:hypothetical protein
MAAYKSKGVGKGQGQGRGGGAGRAEEMDPKLSSTLMQEFQNLKDKFKNEDEEHEKGTILKISRMQ